MPPENWCGYSPARSRSMPTVSSISPAFCQASFFEQCSCRRIISQIWSPTVFTGSREVIGSWKIMAISSPRMARISRSLSVKRSLPLKYTFPLSTLAGGFGRIRRILSAVVVLPAPVSPTKPSASPSPTCRSRSLTAWTRRLPERYSTVRFSILKKSFMRSVPHSYCLSLGSSASRSPSPSTFRLKMVMAMARPGNRHI